MVVKEVTSYIKDTFGNAVKHTIETGDVHGIMLCIDHQENISLGETKSLEEGKEKSILIIGKGPFMLKCPPNTKKEISVVIYPGYFMLGKGVR